MTGIRVLQSCRISGMSDPAVWPARIPDKYMNRKALSTKKNIFFQSELFSGAGGKFSSEGAGCLISF